MCTSLVGFFHCISSGLFSSVSIRVLALFTLKQGHRGEMSDDPWRAKGSQVMGAAGSKPLQPGPGGEPRGSSCWNVEGACSYREGCLAAAVGVRGPQPLPTQRPVGKEARANTPVSFSFCPSVHLRDGRGLNQTEARGQRSPTVRLMEVSVPGHRAGEGWVRKGEWRLSRTRLP